MDAEKKKVIENYAECCLKMVSVKCDCMGHLDLEDLKSKINEDTISGVYFENPGYLGVIEPNGQKISDMVHEAGGLSLVGVDPISLAYWQHHPPMVLTSCAEIYSPSESTCITAEASPASWRPETKRNS